MKRTMWFAFMALGLLFVALTTLTITPAHSAPPAQATPSAAAAACAKLKELKLPDTTITTAEYINPIQELPGVTIRGVWPSPASAHGTTTVGDPFCRVVGVTMHLDYRQKKRGNRRRSILSRGRCDRAGNGF